jgi:hypothetical protein
MPFGPSRQEDCDNDQKQQGEEGIKKTGCRTTNHEGSRGSSMNREPISSPRYISTDLFKEEEVPAGAMAI